MMAMRALTAKLALGIVLLTAPAQAAVVQLFDGGVYPLINGNIYTTSGTLTGSYLPGAPAFNDTFTFLYDAPPELTGLATTTNNLLTADYGIDGFNWDWSKDGSSLTSGNGVITQHLLPLLGDGSYVLTLAGVPRSEGGQYTASLAVTAVPLPGAMILFGTALAGFGLVERFRRRRNVATAV